MNYAQMTSLFRVEQRPVSFAIASVANVLITIGSTVALVVGAHKGAIGAVVGNFLGTLVGLRRPARLPPLPARPRVRPRGCCGDEPLRAAARARRRSRSGRSTSSTGCSSASFKGQAEVGIYSLAVRVASVIVFLMTAFQLAWPAFAYSIRDDGEAKRTYAFVLTYLLFVTCWIVARARRARAVDRRRASTDARSSRARPRRCRCSPSRPRRTPATRCSRSGSAARGRRSTTGSSPAPRRS